MVKLYEFINYRRNEHIVLSLNLILIFFNNEGINRSIGDTIIYTLNNGERMIFFDKNNDKRVFSKWIKQHNAVLYKHALWLCGNKTLAADMVQETYIQGWKSMKSLQDKSRVLPWLLTILRRNIFREQREHYRNKETLAYLQNSEIENSSCEMSLIDLYSIFENLSSAHREALLLYILHGFTYEEIAAQLEVPVGTVMSRISRARKAIKGHLGFSGNISNLNNFLK